jgi:hypothetical protein
MESCFCLEDEREGRTRELRRSCPPEVSALPATQSQTLVVKTTTASHRRLVGGYQKPEQDPEGIMAVHHRGSHKIKEPDLIY